MEASERIVEAYMRIAKKCLTIANVKCGNGKEIDLLAIDSKNNRYHIEITISTSDMFSKITDKKLSKDDVKAKPRKKAHYRRTMDFFVRDKFNDSNVVQALKEFGFKRKNYRRVIVSWNANSKARVRAKEEDIDLWFMPNLLESLFEVTTKTGYFSDDERIFQLIGLWMKTKK